jgi:hypothetical protein
MVQIINVDVVTRLKIEVQDGQDVTEVLENMDYEFKASESESPAKILSTEITEWEIK